MAKIDVLDILRAKKCSPAEFNFDSMWIPPMQCYLSNEDVEYLRRIATSIKLSSKIEQKYKMIDDLMRARGFKRFSAGTNRVVYSCLEDTRFVVKIAVDKVGMQDNPMEYKNQFLLKPYVTKMFYHSPCGTVGFVERVLPIKNKAEFKEIAGDVFDILVHKILGEYVMEDIGTKYFMNWGVRVNQSPVLLDYPYLYKLDGNKLYCTKSDPMTGQMCNGEIDYDVGFNHLVCTRCGKVYLASDLRDNSIDNKIIIKRGGTQMSIEVKLGDKVIGSPIQVDDVMKRPAKRRVSTGLVVSVNDPTKGTIDLPTYEAKEETPMSAANCKYDLGVSVNGNDCTIKTESPKKETKKEESKPVKKTTTKTTKKVVKETVEVKEKIKVEEPAMKKETSVEEVAEIAAKVKEDTTVEEAPAGVVEEESEEAVVETAEAEDEDEKYAEYEEMAKVRTKKNSPARDKNGRFVSSKKAMKNDFFDDEDDGRPKKKRNKAKSNFIPAKD